MKDHFIAWWSHPIGMIKATTTNTLDRWDEAGGLRRRLSHAISKIVPSDWGNYFY